MSKIAFQLEIPFLPNDETYPMLRSGKIKAVKGSIASYERDGVRLANGTYLDADIVICGTGFEPNFSFLPEKFAKAVESDGVWLYRHIMHPELPNMAFIGWASTFSNSLTAHLGSVWFADVLKGRFLLPGREAMAREIAEMQAWKRGFMPGIRSRSSIVQLHMLHYHDELLKDMAISPKRKKNFLAELLGTYQPPDYEGVVKNKG